MRRILACLCLLCAALAFAQQALNNDAVIKMVKAGLSDEVVIATVNASPGTYDTTTDGLIALKSAGVSDKVVAAIIARNAGAPPSPSVSTSAPGTAPSTATGVPPGIDTVGVYYRNKDGVWNEVDAEVVNFKTGAMGTLAANAIAPGLLDRYLAKTGFAAQQTKQRHHPDAPANLWEAADGENGHDFGVHGVFDDKSISRDPQLFASHHHGLLGVVAASVGAVAALLWLNR